MTNQIKIVLAAAGVFLLSIITVGCSAIGFNNDCVRAEAGIQAQYSQNQNNYANYFNKLKEMSQVPDMYADDLKKVWDGVMKGRYGGEGSKAVFQFIQEHNPNVDASLYRSIQQAIESGRNSFEADQKTLLDKKRAYQVQLGAFPGSMLASFLGYPRIDLSKYDIVINEATEKAFATKRAEPITLK